MNKGIETIELIVDRLKGLIELKEWLESFQNHQNYRDELVRRIEEYRTEISNQVLAIEVYEKRVAELKAEAAEVVEAKKQAVQGVVEDAKAEALKIKEKASKAALKVTEEAQANVDNIQANVDNLNAEYTSISTLLEEKQDILAKTEARIAEIRALV